MCHCLRAASRWHNLSVTEQPTFRQGRGPYAADYRGWDQNRVILVRLRLDASNCKDPAALSRAVASWLAHSTFPVENSTPKSEATGPKEPKTRFPEERGYGGCRLTWFLHGDAITMSICSGGEDGIDSTDWCCQEITEVALSACPKAALRWEEWRASDFSELEDLYFPPLALSAQRRPPSLTPAERQT